MANPNFSAGPEKYREHGIRVPRKADIWQEGRSLCNEEPRNVMVSLATEDGKGEIIELCFYFHLK